jgi:hypothetical protein
VRQAARRAGEAARPAAEDEGIRVDQAEAVAEQPRLAMARELASSWSSSAPTLPAAWALTCATAPASSAQRSG